MQIFQYFKKSPHLGPLCISIAGFLWATDVGVRFLALKISNPLLLICIEHFILSCCIAGYAVSSRLPVLRMSLKQWLLAGYTGAIGSGLAMVIFSWSLAYSNPSVVTLMQKLQPILVSLLAFIFLKERPTKKFFIGGIIALFATLVVACPNFSTQTYHTYRKDLNLIGLFYGFMACLMWASTTVTGKILSNDLPSLIITFWRFFFGFIASLGLICWQNPSIFLEALMYIDSPQHIGIILYLSFITGLLAMLLYYKGLSTTPASLASVLELTYPISTILLNALLLGIHLTLIQWVAAGVLLLTLTWLSRSK